MIEHSLDDSRPLKKRLVWTAENPRVREEEADRRRQVSTDNVRNRLLDRYNGHDIDILTQVRLIHRAHMKANEHYLLSPNQAQRVIDEALCTTDRLAGIIRSPWRLSLDIGFGGRLIQCASYQKTPEFMQAVADQAEKMFPIHSVNPDVDKSNIYHFASAFQYIIALIHPFYEANGRTSEDSMYILWKRRPDLAHTLRYVSNNGSRTGNNVDIRMKLINNGAEYTLQDIAQELGVVPGRLCGINSYPDLVEELGKNGISPKRVSAIYSLPFDRHIQELIANFTNINYLRSHRVIKDLAEHLKYSPRSYYSKAA